MVLAGLQAALRLHPRPCFRGHTCIVLPPQQPGRAGAIMTPPYRCGNRGQTSLLTMSPSWRAAGKSPSQTPQSHSALPPHRSPGHTCLLLLPPPSNPQPLHTCAAPWPVPAPVRVRALASHMACMYTHTLACVHKAHMTLTLLCTHAYTDTHVCAHACPFPASWLMSGPLGRHVCSPLPHVQAGPWLERTHF